MKALGKLLVLFLSQIAFHEAFAQSPASGFMEGLMNGYSYADDLDRKRTEEARRKKDYEYLEQERAYKLRLLRAQTEALEEERLRRAEKAQLALEQQKQSSNNQWDYLKAIEAYQDPIWKEKIDVEVKRLASDQQNNGKEVSWFLTEAHKNVLQNAEEIKKAHRHAPLPNNGDIK